MSLFSVSSIGLIFLIKNRILSKDFHKDTWDRLFKGGLALTLG